MQLDSIVEIGIVLGGDDEVRTWVGVPKDFGAKHDEALFIQVFEDMEGSDEIESLRLPVIGYGPGASDVTSKERSVCFRVPARATTSQAIVASLESHGRPADATKVAHKTATGTSQVKDCTS